VALGNSGPFVGQTVYVDTSVWAHHAGSDKDPLSPACTPFFEGIERGEFTPIISTFVRQEFVGFMKQLVTEKKGAPLDPDEIGRIVGGFTRIMDKFGVEIYDADALAAEGISTNPLFRRSEEIVVSADVPRDALRDPSSGAWRHLGASDALHSAFAERSGATRVATCDYGFRGLRASVKAIVLMDVYP
jgi:predicted nucleic acid-binding protein